MQYGSFQNQIMANTVSGSKIEVGMGATILMWSDRHAATVIEWDGKTIVVQSDIAKRVDRNGMSELQDYAYEPDPNGAKYTFKLDRAGGWRAMESDPVTGRPKMAAKGGGYGLQLGHRNHYHDFSF